jgi:hypothetical protein
MKAIDGITGGIAHSFLTLALDGGELSISHSGRAQPHGKASWYPLDRRLGGTQSQSGLEARRKIL